MDQQHVGSMRPHRGVLILVLGILSLVMSCFPLGIVAWVLGHSDLKDMEAGVMDPEGRGMTLAGKILGIVSVALTLLGLAIWVVLVLVFGVAAAAGAAAQP
ncbi:MAG: DUF4190 domain-containing protein [Phycisphaerales bacterium]